jgi:hypothetical protein
LSLRVAVEAVVEAAVAAVLAVYWHLQLLLIPVLHTQLLLVLVAQDLLPTQRRVQVDQIL